MHSLIVLAALVAVSQAQVVGFGSCPKYTVAETLDAAKYFTGRWYAQKRFWAVFQNGAECVNADYKIKPDGHVLVNNSAFRNNARDNAIGDAYCDSNSSAVCHVKFSQAQSTYGNYNVLATDYTKYGLVYSCSEYLGGTSNLQYAWILTRSKQVSEEDMRSYVDVYTKNGVDVKHFQDVLQNCSDN